MRPDCYKKVPLAFYAWTDTLILNAVKVKVTYFLNYQADLFILELPRISRSLVEQLKKQEIFQEVLWIKPPFDDMPACRRKFSKAFLIHQYRTCYFTQLQQISRNYGVLFAGALWSETIMLFQYLRQYNPQLVIYIIEEGTANYCGIRAITRCDPLNAWRDKVIRKTRYAGIYEKAVEAISGMFLACPEGCLNKEGESIFPVSGHESLAFRRLISSCTAELMLEEYHSRHVIFFLQPEYGLDWENTLRLIQAVVLAVGPKNIIIRPHPNSGNVIWQLNKILPSEVYVETVQFPFEYVLYTTGWQDKILISRGSSCLFYPRYICGQEPVVIFTNRLYDDRKKRADAMPFLIDRLKEIYKTSDDIFCPETIADLKKYLKGKHFHD